MNSPVDDYLDAKADYDSVNAEIDELSKVLATTSEALRRKRDQFMISNTGVSLPAEVAFSRNQVGVDARSWPTAKGAMELLNRWHDARTKMRDAWDKVPDSRRGGLHAPPRDSQW